MTDTTQAKELLAAATAELPECLCGGGSLHKADCPYLAAEQPKYRALTEIAHKDRATLAVAIKLADYAKAQACGCVEYAGPDDYPCNRCKALAEWAGLFPKEEG